MGRGTDRRIKCFLTSGSDRVPRKQWAHTCSVHGCLYQQAAAGGGRAAAASPASPTTSNVSQHQLGRSSMSARPAPAAAASWGREAASHMAHIHYEDGGHTTGRAGPAGRDEQWWQPSPMSLSSGPSQVLHPPPTLPSPRHLPLPFAYGLEIREHGHKASAIY